MMRIPMREAAGVRGRLRGAVAVLAAAVTLLAACGDDPEGPGTITATVVSPNGAEGSAVVALYGPGLGTPAPIEGRVFGQVRGDTLRVVVVNPDGGPLRFTVAVDDVSRLPTGAVLEVAGPDDQLRTLGGYEVEVVR